jgi:hypothetical protein
MPPTDTDRSSRLIAELVDVREARLTRNFDPDAQRVP